MDKRYFSDKIVKWYENNKRQLPWRETNDPYKIWLSEIILQQTRVIQGLPYYLRFIGKFPTVDALAAASEQEVLRLWQGLGYYTRARNLHKCAREVVENHQSVFPATFEALKNLRGIGEYTAAAIASISYKEKVAVVDGNVFRVLSRVFGIDKEINSPEGKRAFTTLANTLIGPDNPDIHNQAMMEFGALYCTPKSPACGQCIFREGCFAANKNLQHLLPIKAKNKKQRKRYFYYFVIRKGKSILMKKREGKDIWNGLYDFYQIESQKPGKVESIVQEFNEENSYEIQTENVQVSPPYKHVLTHQIIFSRFITVDVPSTFELSGGSFKFYSARKIASLPKPVLIDRFLADSEIL
ncbi:MAG: A/G-specific adenine glycosylase [Chryseolinea sp.]